MKKKLNIIIVGGSYKSTIGSTHLKSIILSNKFNISGCFFSRNKLINLKSSTDYGIDKSKLFYNLTDLIKKKLNDVDCAVVLVPPKEKINIFKKLIKNNINIISEKPISSTSKDAKIIQKLLLEYNTKLFTTYNYLGYPAILQIKEMINKIGKIQNIDIEMPQDTFTKSNDNLAKWRRKDGKVPIILLDLTSHCLSFVKYFFNSQPKEYFAFGTKNKRLNVIDTFESIINYSNFYSKISVSKNKYGERNNLKIRIYGTLGSIKWFHSKPEEILFSNKKNFKSTLRRSDYDTAIKNNYEIFTYKDGHPNGFLDAFSNIYKSIYFLLKNKSVKKNYPKILSISENVQLIKDLENLSLSAKKRKWIKAK